MSISFDIDFIKKERMIGTSQIVLFFKGNPGIARLLFEAGIISLTEDENCDFRFRPEVC